jgi:hypothetical protein
MAVPGRPAARPQTTPDQSRWASTVAAAAMATLAMVLMLFSFPSFRRTCELPSPPSALPPREPWSDDHFRSPDAAQAPRSETDGTPAPLDRGQPVPRVARLAGSIAGAGHKVTVLGTGLVGATEVYFVTGDGRARPARFLAWDDGRLVVVVPDLGPRPLSASVVVVTPDGTTAHAGFYYTGH